MAGSLCDNRYWCHHSVPLDPDRGGSCAAGDSVSERIDISLHAKHPAVAAVESSVKMKERID